MRGAGIRIFLVLWFLLFLPVPGSAASLLVSWEANTESDLAGYRLYYGTKTGTYGTPVTLGKVTSCQLSNVSAGNTYYLVLTAYDASGNESSPSPEVSASVPVSQTPGAISLVSPLEGAVLSSSPSLSWKGTGFSSYKVYSSLSGKSYTRIYSGTRTSLRLSSTFWSLLVPSGSTVSWYVEGTTSGGRTGTSPISCFKKQ